MPCRQFADNHLVRLRSLKTFGSTIQSIFSSTECRNASVAAQADNSRKNETFISRFYFCEGVALSCRHQQKLLRGHLRVELSQPESARASVLRTLRIEYVIRDQISPGGENGVFFPLQRQKLEAHEEVKHQMTKKAKHHGQIFKETRCLAEIAAVNQK